MDNELGTLLSVAPDIGATIIVFALLWYAFKQSQQQHERELERAKQNAATMREVINSLMDCLKAKNTTPPN